MKPVHRKVRLQNTDSAQRAGMAVFASKSFSNANDNEDRYSPCVDLETGRAVCDCPHYLFRLAKLEPTCYSPPKHLCKHLRHGIRRLGELGKLPHPKDLQLEDGCIHCGHPAQFDICDERGEPETGKRICLNCIVRLRLQSQRNSPSYDR